MQSVPVSHCLVPQLALGCEWATLEIVDGGVVRRDHARARARFDRHVAYRHAPFHGKAAYRGAGELYRIAGAARRADLADHRERDVLGGDTLAQRAIHQHLHGLGFFRQQTLCRHHVLDLGRADAERQRGECAVRAGVRIAAHHRHARQGRALLRPDHMHDALTHIGHFEFVHAKLDAITVQRFHLPTRDRIGDTLRARGGRHVMIGTAGGTGYAIEFAGTTIRGLSMEGRMTVCNMAIEAGARAGMIAADYTTINYLKGRPFAPQGELWDKAVAYWHTLHSDEGAQFDQLVKLDAAQIKPQVTWGTSPEMVVAVDGRVPDPATMSDAVKRQAAERALQYMGLAANTPIAEIRIDKVFIGSCTNSRIEDLRAAAVIARGKHVAANVKLAMVVPGSGLVKRQAEQEGLDKIFIAAGFEWREPGCSMCLAMNDDKLSPGERCASTSNRNFEGRQGQGGRTHLVSPEMAAAAAIAGHFVDVSKC